MLDFSGLNKELFVLVGWVKFHGLGAPDSVHEDLQLFSLDS